MKFTKRSVITVLTFFALLSILFVGASNVTIAGETAVVPVATPVVSVTKDCGGNEQATLFVSRWTPVRNLITKSRVRCAARRAARSSCCSPQTVEVKSVQVITVAPVRLFRGCATGVCK